MPPKARSMEKRKDVTDLDHERFIERHRLKLLHYPDVAAGRSMDEVDELACIENVLTEWQEVFGESELSEPSPQERTFWFGLYQLEELVELPGPNIDPFEKIMLENLIKVRELLRHRQSLTGHGFMATRPDGT